jgi:peptidoglycan hydrolase-like protein with peptidoglycan-binding domain
MIGATTELPSVFNTDAENEQIEQGHSGVSSVKLIQQALKSKNYDPGTIDGFWGPNTCRAILDFQRAKFGTAKGKYLDYDTFVALGFDIQQADRYASQYGTVCGGITEPPSDYGPGSAPDVSQNDIKKIQAALKRNGYSLALDGIWGVDTCTALFDLQKKNSKTDSNLLLASTFRALGFDTATAQTYAQSFGQVCGPWWSPEAYVGIDPADEVIPVKDNKIPDPGIIPPEPQKASVPIIVAVGLGLGVLGAILFGKKKGRR